MGVKGAFNHTMMAACAILLALGTAGCGGGVSTAGGGSGTTALQKAVLTLSTSGTMTAGTEIGGLGVTVDLPDTVTVKTNNGNVDSSVVTATGAASGQATVLALYSGPTLTAPAKLYLVLSSASSGVAVGEFATITCAVKSGADPVGSDFSLKDFSAVDTSGASISSLTAAFHETIQ